MPFRSALVCMLALMPSLAGCYSLARIRLSQEVHTEGAAAVLELWIDAPGPMLSGDPPHHVYDACMSLVLYPLDKLLSLSVAVKAPFDDDIDVQWGPLGVLAGITLPWVTLLPFLYPPFEPSPVELASGPYTELMTRVAAGDGVRAYIELVGGLELRGEVRVPHAVALLRGDRPKTMLQMHRRATAGDADR